MSNQLFILTAKLFASVVEITSSAPSFVRYMIVLIAEQFLLK